MMKQALTQLTEQEQYEASVAKINRHFVEEQRQLEMCQKVYGVGSRECQEMAKRMCEIDMHLDSRGGHHLKPHCAH